MRKAFTLIELMVVVGIMAMMSTLAIGSYSALTRGLNDRAALDAARSLADAAVQRANLDRTNVYIFLFNEVTKLDGEMSAGSACGLAVAVRPVGRITQVPQSDLFCDEFGDLDQTYGALEEEDDEASESERERSASTFRLYNLSRGTYATVREGVFKREIGDKDLEDGAQREWAVHGFKKTGGSATFRVGDLYGQEFSITRLPPGYTFSSSVNMSGTSSLGQKQVGNPVTVKPTDSSTPSIAIYARRPNGSFDNIGNITQAKDGDQ